MVVGVGVGAGGCGFHVEGTRTQSLTAGYSRFQPSLRLSAIVGPLRRTATSRCKSLELWYWVGMITYFVVLGSDVDV